MFCRVAMLLEMNQVIIFLYNNRLLVYILPVYVIVACMSCWTCHWIACLTGWNQMHFYKFCSLFHLDIASATLMNCLVVLYRPLHRGLFRPYATLLCQVLFSYFTRYSKSSALVEEIYKYWWVSRYCSFAIDVKTNSKDLDYQYKSSSS